MLLSRSPLFRGRYCKNVARFREIVRYFVYLGRRKIPGDLFVNVLASHLSSTGPYGCGLENGGRSVHSSSLWLGWLNLDL